MHALNKLLDSNFSRADLFALSARLEGHPENAAAASFGGFNVVRGLEVQRFEVSAELQFVLLVPDFRIKTKKSRRLLPREIPRADAVMSAGNAAFIVAAFATGDYERLRGAFRDGLHQQYRRKLIPFLDDVIASAENPGALGAFLGGDDADDLARFVHHWAAGIARLDRDGDLHPGIVGIGAGERADRALCEARLVHAEKIGRAMQRSAHMETTQVITTNADNRGVRLLKSATGLRQSQLK